MSHKGGNILPARKTGAWNSKQKFPPSLPLDDQSPCFSSTLLASSKVDENFTSEIKMPLLEKRELLKTSSYNAMELIFRHQVEFDRLPPMLVPLCLTIPT